MLVFFFTFSTFLYPTNIRYHTSTPMLFVINDSLVNPFASIVYCAWCYSQFSLSVRSKGVAFPANHRRLPLCPRSCLRLPRSQENLCWRFAEPVASKYTLPVAAETTTNIRFVRRLVLARFTVFISIFLFHSVFSVFNDLIHQHEALNLRSER